MSDSFDQHGAQTPMPSLSGSRQDGQSGGKAKSSTSRTVARAPSRKRAAYGCRPSGLAETSSFMLEP